MVCDRMARPSSLPQIQRKQVHVPVDVPPEARQVYIDNYLAATKGIGRLMLLDDAMIFQGQLELEGPTAEPEGSGPVVASPESSFARASNSSFGLFATSLGLLARYGSDFGDCNYLVKLNGLSHQAGRGGGGPFSNQLWSVEQVLDLIDFTKLKIRAVGYQLYLGSEYEADMLQQAAQVAIEAHSAGLLVIFWVFPERQSTPERMGAARLIGACRSALELGADFVVVSAAEPGDDVLDVGLIECVVAAGRTGVVTTGGGSADPQTLLEQAFDLMNSAGVAGYSMGHMAGLSSDEAVGRLMNGLASIVVGGHDVADAMKVYEGKEQFKV